MTAALPPNVISPLDHLDPLTNLPDRYMLGYRLREETEKGQQSDLPYSLLLLDIDHFKSINDAFGHTRGDQVLLELAHRLKALSRETDQVFRYGGDEFVILLPNTRKPAAVIFARRLIDQIGSAPILGAPPINISLSIGVASFPEDGLTPETVFEVADQRHYSAKREGRQRLISESPPDTTGMFLESPIRLIEREQAQDILYSFLNSLPNQGRGVCRVTGLAGTGRSRFLWEAQKAARLLGYAFLPIQGKPFLRNRVYGALLETILDMNHLPLPLQGVKVFAQALSSWILEKGKVGLLLTIDDLQFLDSATVKFLEQLFYDNELPQLGLIYSDDGTVDSRSFPRNIPLQELVVLNPLSKTGLQIWLRHTLRWEAPEEFIHWLYDQTFGLPGVIQQSLTFFINQGLLRQTQNVWIYPRDLDQIPLRKYLSSLAEPPPNNLHTYLPGSLPEFVGREKDLQILKNALRERSVVTIIGPGGIGKSRLALQLAREMMEFFSDGLFFVPLSGIRSTNLLLTALAETLQLTFSGLQASKPLVFNALRGKRLLLILDNFERLVDGAHWIIELLEYAPSVRILVTSRERIGLTDELVYELDGLTYPREFPDSDEILEEYPAVQLFCRSVQRHRDVAALPKDQMKSVVQICRQVEGVPLAIELASAWIPIFTPAEIAAGLAQNQKFLNADRPDLPSRHRSFTALLDSFWKTLSHSEQKVLSKLAIFEGAFHASAAKAVADASSFFLEALADKFFVRRIGESRYELHELPRQFVLQRLKAGSRSWVFTRDRHSEYYLRMLYDAESIKRGDPTVINPIRENLQNVRAAWDWALSRARLEVIRRAIQGMAAFFHLAGLQPEAENAFGAAIEQVQAWRNKPNIFQQEQQLVLAELLALHASFLTHRGKYTQAIEAAQSAVELGRQLKECAIEAAAQMEWAKALDRQLQQRQALIHAREALSLAQSAEMVGLQIEALRLLGSIALNVNREEALQSFQRALEMAGAVGDERQQAAIRLRLGLIHNLGGDIQASRLELEQALSIYIKLDDKVGRGSSLNNLGKLAFSIGDHYRARQYFEQALQIAQETGNLWSMNVNLVNLGLSSQRLGDFGNARAYLEQAIDTSRLIGEWGSEAGSISTLGLIAYQSGDFSEAEKLERQAYDLATEHEDGLLLQSIALVRLGHALTGLRRYEEADESYQRSVELRQQIGRLELRLDPWAGLAYSALCRNLASEALKFVEEIILNVDGIVKEDHSDDPFWVYWICYQVLRANGDERAMNWYDLGRSILLAQANQIEDDLTRQIFLEAIPSHRFFWQEQSDLETL